LKMAKAPGAFGNLTFFPFSYVNFN